MTEDAVRDGRSGVGSRTVGLILKGLAERWPSGPCQKEGRLYVENGIDGLGTTNEGGGAQTRRPSW